MASNYRSDIDGLRAVAVLAVIIYHIRPGAIRAGFSGVDIFFVISGFLITSIIARELRDGAFSFLGFYARRIRRIYPALLVVLILTLIAGFVLMLPPDYRRLGESTPFAAFGLSNLYFLTQVGYFAAAADSLPLLHTWSLGVEEQFYLVWPLIAWFVWRLFGGRRFALPATAGAITLLSLAYALWAAPDDPGLVFYSPLTRAWELGLGAMAAFAPPIRAAWLGQIKALLGVVLIVMGIAREAGPANLHNILYACAGATLLVWPTTTPSLVARGLGLLPLRFLGQISYSLYLWHWPLLVLLNRSVLLTNELPETLIGPFAIGMIALAAASWLVIERPFRRRTALPSRTTVLAGVGAMAIIGVAGGTILALDGVPSRFPAKAVYYANFENPSGGRPELYNCWHSGRRDETQFDREHCVNMDPSRPNVLLIGDSHANQFIGALRMIFPEINFSYVGSSGCFPLYRPIGEPRCQSVMKKVYDIYIPSNPYDAIILSARWKDGPQLSRFTDTMTFLKAHTRRIVILGPSEEFRTELTRLLAYAEIRGPQVITQGESRKKVGDADAKMRALSAQYGAEYFSPFDFACGAGPCLTLTPDGVPMMQDANHLSGPGAILTAAALRQQGLLAPLLTPPVTPPAGAPPR